MGLCSDRPQPPPRSSGQGPLPFSNVLSSRLHTWVITFLLVLCPLLPTEAACMGHLRLKVPKELPEGLPALDSFVFLLSVQSGQ